MLVTHWKPDPIPSSTSGPLLPAQLVYYKESAQAAQAALSRLQIIVYLVGGVGTLLATFKLQILVAITTSVTTALNTLIEKEAYGEAVQVFNFAVNELMNTMAWWNALSAVEQARKETF